MRHQQAGIAALTAILVVAIATVLAVNLMWGTSVDIQRTQNLLEQDQARLYDLGGEELGKFFLAEDARENPEIDSTQEFWSQLLVRQFKDGTLEGWLVDQLGLFDLNSLVDQGTTKRNDEAAEQFARLLQLLDLEPEPNLDAGTAAELTEAVIDWIDPDTQPEPLRGAEDDQYTSLQPQYLTANFWFVSVSELQAVRGFTPAILKALKPHITALPPQGQPPQGGGAQRWPINVNTATRLVLASLVPGQDEESVDPFYGKEFETITEFEEIFRPETGQDLPPGIPLGTQSTWFLLTVTTTIGTNRSTMYSLLERKDAVVRTRLRSFDAN